MLSDHTLHAGISAYLIRAAYIFPAPKLGFSAAHVMSLPQRSMLFMVTVPHPIQPCSRQAAHLAGEICLGARSMSSGSLSLWRLWCRWCLCLGRCSSRSLLSPPPSFKGAGRGSPVMPPSSGLYRLLPRPFTLLAACMHACMHAHAGTPDAVVWQLVRDTGRQGEERLNQDMHSDTPRYKYRQTYTDAKTVTKWPNTTC